MVRVILLEQNDEAAFSPSSATTLTAQLLPISASLLSAQQPCN
jgi:hypothetical protein